MRRRVGERELAVGIDPHLDELRAALDDEPLPVAVAAIVPVHALRRAVGELELDVDRDVDRRRCSGSTTSHTYVPVSGASVSVTVLRAGPSPNTPRGGVRAPARRPCAPTSLMPPTLLEHRAEEPAEILAELALERREQIAAGRVLERELLRVRLHRRERTSSLPTMLLERRERARRASCRSPRQYASSSTNAYAAVAIGDGQRARIAADRSPQRARSSACQPSQSMPLVRGP